MPIMSVSNTQATVKTARTLPSFGSTLGKVRVFQIDGKPTDEFIKTMRYGIPEFLPEGKLLDHLIFLLHRLTHVTPYMKKDVNSAEIFKEHFIERVSPARSIFEAEKPALLLQQENIGKMPREIVDKIKETKNHSELRQLIGNLYDEKFKGKSLDEIKATLIEEDKESIRILMTDIFSHMWDNTTKSFKKTQNGMGDVLDKLVNIFQRNEEKSLFPPSFDCGDEKRITKYYSSRRHVV